MRKLPSKRSLKQNRILSAVYDYYGSEITAKEKQQSRQIAIYLMGRKKGVNLSEEQKLDMWAIKENLGDKVYCKAL